MPDNGGIPTWAEVKAQAAAMLGIALNDFDVHDVPLLRTDLYGNFIPDPATGFAQVITGAGADGILNTGDDVVVVGSPGAPVSPTAVDALRTGHAFLNDIAHHAAPGMFDPDGPGASTRGLASGRHRPRHHRRRRRRRPMTTNCSMRTSSPATAAATRTSP